MDFPPRSPRPYGRNSVNHGDAKSLTKLYQKAPILTLERIIPGEGTRLGRRCRRLSGTMARCEESRIGIGDAPDRQGPAAAGQVAVVRRFTGKGTTPPPFPLEPPPEDPPRYSCSLVVRSPRTPWRSISRCQEVNSSEDSE